jgi:FG-GAP-like repeat
VGQLAELVKLRDLNGDGKLDLATIDRDTSSVSTLLNRGDGSFDSRRTYTTGRRPRSLAIGDLTGDGKPELVTANAYLSEPDHRNPGTVSVFVNKGDGTFRTKVDYHPGKFPRSVALSDLNADGKLDMATANVDANTASVFMNRGKGVLEPRRDYRVGRAPGALAIGDLNGDGNPDLVTLSPSTEKVSVLINSGRGSFRPPRSYRAVPPDALPPHIGPPLTLAIGDLNGDGRPDLETVSECSSAIAVLNNRGDGTFEENIDYRTACATSVAIGELNGDDKNDLATVNSSAPSPRVDSIYVFINRPGRCTVQPVVSRSLAAAKSALVRANCGVGTIRLRNSRRGVKGQVIDQSPSFGALLPGKVNLVVSRGRQR